PRRSSSTSVGEPLMPLPPVPWIRDGGGHVAASVRGAPELAQQFRRRQGSRRLLRTKGRRSSGGRWPAGRQMVLPSAPSAIRDPRHGGPPHRLDRPPADPRNEASLRASAVDG